MRRQCRGKAFHLQQRQRAVQQGDEVIIPAPYWVSFPDIIKYAGGTPVYVQTKPEDGFVVKASAIEKAITPKTKMVILNSPSNPAGGVIHPEEYQRILARLQKTQCLADGRRVLFPFRLRTAQTLLHRQRRGSKENVIIIGSVSKTFAMTGWRVGYTLAPEDLIQAIIKLQSQSTSNPSSIAQYAALEAITRNNGDRSRHACRIQKRRKRIVEGLRAIPGVTCEWPGGASTRSRTFPLISQGQKPVWRKTYTELSKELLDKAHVALVPGDAFGAPGFLRISYATSIERIEEGLRRLDRFFSRAEAAA